MKKTNEQDHSKEKCLLKSFYISSYFSFLESRVLNVLRHRVGNGRISVSELYEKLGKPVMDSKFERLVYPNELFDSLIDSVKNGKLVLVYSSWNEGDARDDEKQGKKPGVDDMYPDKDATFETNLPIYRVSVAKDSISVYVMYSNKENQGFKYLDTDEAWGIRTFVFKNPEGDLSEENLMLVKDLIIDQEVYRCMYYKYEKALVKIADMLIDDDYEAEEPCVKASRITKP